MSPEVQQSDGPPTGEDFSNQPKLFDYTFTISRDTNPLVRLADLGFPELSEGLLGEQTVADFWLSMLEDDTPIETVFSLLDVEDPDEQAEKAAGLLDHATDAGIAVGRGQTLGDLREGDAPNLYDQLFRPQLRPTQTPEGQPFPYSHFGDTAVRTELLRDIKYDLSLSPKTVVNMGSGYDVTPSDAFPDARVVHVDIDSGIVDFLRRSGFEAYLPEHVPEELVADLIIDVLGPGQGNIPLSPRGILLTTQKGIPEDMTVKGVVPSNRHAVLPPVTDPEAIQEVMSSMHLDVHLLALTPKA